MDKGQAHTKLDERLFSDAKKRYENSFKTITETPDGRAFLWAILCRCGTLASPFSSDSIIAAYSSGRQSIGLELLEELTTLSPESYLELLKENLNDRASSNARHAAIDRADTGTDYYAD